MLNSCSFISANSLVTCLCWSICSITSIHYSQWMPRTCIINTHWPSFETFHPFVHSPLAHTIITILNCHFAINFSTFYTLWSQWSDSRSLLFFGAFYHWRSHAKACHSIITTQKIMKSKLNAIGRFILFVSTTFFSVSNITCGKHKFALFFTSPCIFIGNSLFNAIIVCLCAFYKLLQCYFTFK